MVVTVLSTQVGYINRCPHINLELDMEDARMFTRDGLLLQCKAALCAVHAQ